MKFLDIEALSEQTLDLMRTFDIPVRKSDSNSARVPRIAEGLDDSKPAQFVAGPDFLTEEHDESKRAVTGYTYPLIRVSHETYHILFVMKNALKQKYYESIIVHELVHFWEVRFIDAITNKDEYTHQDHNPDGYMEQPSEMNAYLIQAIFYFNLTKKNQLTEEPKNLINKMFTAEGVKYRYR